MAYPYQFGGGMNMASPQIRQKQNKGTTPKKNQGQTSLLRRLQINMLGSPQAGPATRTLPYQVGQPQAGPAMKTLPYVVNQAATMADNRVATPGQIQNVIGAAFDAPPSAGEL